VDVDEADAGEPTPLPVPDDEQPATLAPTSTAAMAALNQSRSRLSAAMAIDPPVTPRRRRAAAYEPEVETPLE